MSGPPQPGPAVVLRHVDKRFGAIRAVDDLSLEVAPGTCFGLLGPNGAGKSTTMRLLIGQATADSGDIAVLGHPLPGESKAARARSGVVAQKDNLDDELTVAENLAVAAHLHGVPRAERRDAVARALVFAQLSDRADTPTDELSGGMRRRLLLARGLLHGPELVLLDEPTVGLDPQIRQQLWTQIDAIRDRGITVVMTTHYIEEAERLCDEVAVIAHGRLVAQGPPSELVRTHVGVEVLEIPARSAELSRVEQEARAVGLRTRRAGTTVAVLGVERGAIDGLGPGRRRPANLEDVFVVLTGEELS